MKKFYNKLLMTFGTVLVTSLLIQLVGSIFTEQNFKEINWYGLFAIALTFCFVDFLQDIFDALKDCREDIKKLSDDVQRLQEK